MEIILWLEGVTTTHGIVLKDHSIRAVENHHAKQYVLFPVFTMLLLNIFKHALREMLDFGRGYTKTFQPSRTFSS